MPPAPGGRFSQNHLSNPFVGLQHQQLQQHAQNLQHPSGIQSHQFTSQPGFGSQNPGIFNPQNAANALHSATSFAPSLAGGGLGGPGGGGGSGLASHAAQMGFHNASGLGGVLAQQEHAGAMGKMNGTDKRVREVWKGNLQQEMYLLRSLVDRYPYISMDTEFPGVIARPMGDFTTKASYHYQTLRCNVDLLKIIQLGVTLFSIDGDLPPAQPIETSLLAQHSRNGFPAHVTVCPCTWQFNFQFDLENDMYNMDSTNVLRKAGLQFERLPNEGIDPQEFGSLLITSGLTMSENVTWLSFHSGYDFAYLIKLMWNQALPTDEDAWRDLLSIFFPSLYDVKFLLRHAQKLVSPATPSSASTPKLAPTASSLLNELGQKSGLQDLADCLGCVRMGSAHQAGSDAWLTGLVFFAMRDKIFPSSIPEEVNGEIWGLTSVGAPASAATQAAAIAAAGANTNNFNNNRDVLSGNNADGSRFGGMFSPYGGGGGSSTGEGGPRTPTNQQAGLAGASGQRGGNTPGPFGQYGGHGGHQPLTTPQGGVFGQFTHPSK